MGPQRSVAVRDRVGPGQPWGEGCVATGFLPGQAGCPMKQNLPPVPGLSLLAGPAAMGPAPRNAGVPARALQRGAALPGSLLVQNALVEIGKI